MLRKIVFWTLFVMTWLDLAATMLLAGSRHWVPCAVAAVLFVVLMASGCLLDPRERTPRPRGVRQLSHLDHIISEVLWDEFNGEKKEQAEWDG